MFMKEPSERWWLQSKNFLFKFIHLSFAFVIKHFHFNTVSCLSRLPLLSAPRTSKLVGVTEEKTITKEKLCQVEYGSEEVWRCYQTVLGLGWLVAGRTEMENEL